jgi:hypothetical protein
MVSSSGSRARAPRSSEENTVGFDEIAFTSSVFGYGPEARAILLFMPMDRCFTAQTPEPFVRHLALENVEVGKIDVI